MGGENVCSFLSEDSASDLLAPGASATSASGATLDINASQRQII